MSKQVDSAERRQQILDTFTRCLQKKSYFETTIRDVAREAGVAPGLIYYYFENKEKLLMAVFEQAMEHFYATLEHYFRILGEQDVHSQEFEQALLCFLVEYYGGNGWEDCAVFNALWALAQYSMPLKQAMHDSYVRFEEEVRKLMACHLPEEVDAGPLARLILVILDGIVIYSTIYHTDLQQRVDVMQHAVRIFAESSYLRRPMTPLPQIDLPTES